MSSGKGIDMTKQLTITNAEVSFKAGFAVTIPFASYTDAVLQDILREGAKRVLSDGIGKAELTLDEKRALVAKRMDSWARGDFAARTRESGPETAESRARKIVVGILQKTDAYKPAKLKDEVVRKAFGDRVAILAKEQRFLDMAKRQLDDEAAIGDVEI